MRLSRITLAALSLAGVTLSSTALANPIAGWSPLWNYQHSLTGVAGQTSEIPAFDAATNTLWVVGLKGIDVLNARTGGLVQHIDTSVFGEANSVSIFNGVAAVAMANGTNKLAAGTVQFYDTGSRLNTGSVGVGTLPDMLTFSRDGRTLLVANEAERLGAADAPGSVSIINMSTRTVTATAGFAGVPVTGPNVRIFDGRNGTTVQDFEPEYIAISPDNTKAFVALQEANAIATLDLATGQFTSVKGLGAKDYRLPGNAVDPTDRDFVSGNSGPTRVELRNVPLKGLYQPDAIASYRGADGQTYIVTANEGDANFDDADLARASTLGVTGELGRTNISKLDSTKDDLYSFGARSFSIWNENMEQVFDSGSMLDTLAIAAKIYADGRSDDKGVEPEGLSLLQVGDRTLAFIGLERTTKSSVAVFDVTDPKNVSFIDYLISESGDVSPEGLSAFEMDGFYHLAVANEVSGTTSVYRLAAVTAPVPEPEAYALMLAGLGVVAAAARRRRA